jgi:hypothetical protein
VVVLDHRHYLVLASCQGRIPYLVASSLGYLGYEESAELASSLALGYEAYLDLVGSAGLALVTILAASFAFRAYPPNRSYRRNLNLVAFLSPRGIPFTKPA